MKNLIFPAMLVFSIALHADEKVFPNKDGSSDLASEAAWGDVVLNDVDKATITSVNGTYHASENVDLKGIFFRNDTRYSTNTIDQTLYPDVEIKARNGIAINNGSRIYSYAELIGGKYDLENTGNLANAIGWNNGRSNTLVVSGSIITNVSNLHVSQRTEANVMEIRDGAEIYTKNFSPFNSNLNKDAVLEISSGSKVTVFNTANINIASGENNSRNKLLLSGEGTVLSNTYASAYIIGGASCSQTLIGIENGAKFHLNGGAFLWNGTFCASNRVEIDGGKFISSSTIYYPRYNSSCDNEISVKNGGIFEITSNPLQLNGTNNSITVSDATFKINNQFSFGNTASAHKCRFSISGASSVYDVATIIFLFNEGSGHVFEITNNAKINLTNSLYLFNSAQTNTLLLTEGGSLTTPNVLMRSYYDKKCNGNTIFIGNNSRIESSTTAAYCNDNRIVVSNGTLNCSSALKLGAKFSENSTESTSNNSLVLQGTSPTVSAYMFYIDNSSKLVLDLSEGIYTDTALISAEKIIDDGTTAIEINNVEACLKNLDKKTDITFISARNDLPKNLNDAISSANAKLPEGCTLYLSSDKRSLMLHLTPVKGFKIIVR